MRNYGSLFIPHCLKVNCFKCKVGYFNKIKCLGPAFCVNISRIKSRELFEIRGYAYISFYLQRDNLYETGTVSELCKAKSDKKLKRLTMQIECIPNENQGVMKRRFVNINFVPVLDPAEVIINGNWDKI